VLFVPVLFLFGKKKVSYILQWVMKFLANFFAGARAILQKNASKMAK